MLRKLKDNRQGLVLVTVLVIVMVMLVLTVTMLSLNVSQVMTAENEVKRIQAENLAIGALSYTFSNQMITPSSEPLSLPETLDSVHYTVTATRDASQSGLYGTNPLNITVNY